MDIKAEIKEELNISDFSSQNEREDLFEYCEVNTKTEIEEEPPCFPDLCSQNETEIFSKESVQNVKSESVTSNNDCELNIPTEVARVYSTNEAEYFPNIKVEIKEQWWLERSSTETSSVYEETKNEVDVDLILADLPRVCLEGVSKSKTPLFSDEALQKDRSLKIKAGSLEYDKNKMQKSKLCHRKILF